MKTLHTFVLLVGWLSTTFLVGCGGESAPRNHKQQSGGIDEARTQDGDPDTLIRGGYDPAEMDAAIARAKREVDDFIKIMQSRDGEDFSVKVPIEENGETEHFWLVDIRYADGEFTGEIGNDPGIVKKVHLGMKWTVNKEDISDWMFTRKGLIHGNYTMRPLLKTLPKAQADEYRKMLAD